MQEIIEELKKINKSIEYQTKLLEEIYIKKNESQENSNVKLVAAQEMVNNMSGIFKAKGMDNSIFENMLKLINPLVGENKNEHKIP